MSYLILPSFVFQCWASAPNAKLSRRFQRSAGARGYATLLQALSRVLAGPGAAAGAGR